MDESVIDELGSFLQETADRGVSVRRQHEGN